MERIVKNKIGVETKIYAQTFEFEAYSQIKKLLAEDITWTNNEIKRILVL